MISLWKTALLGILLAVLVPWLAPSVLPEEWLDHLPSTSALDQSLVTGWLSGSLLTLEPLLVKVIGKEAAASALGWFRETVSGGGRFRRAPFSLVDITPPQPSPAPAPPPPPTTTSAGCSGGHAAPVVKTIFAIGGHSFVDYNINQTQWGWEIGPLSQHCRPRIYDLYQDCKRNAIQHRLSCQDAGEMTVVYYQNVLTVEFSTSCSTFSETNLNVDYRSSNTSYPPDYSCLGGKCKRTFDFPESKVQYKFTGLQNRPIYLIGHALTFPRYCTRGGDTYGYHCPTVNDAVVCANGRNYMSKCDALNYGVALADIVDGKCKIELCTMDMNPVCVNGRQYSNRCVARRDGALEKEIVDGRCATTSSSSSTASPSSSSPTASPTVDGASGSPTFTVTETVTKIATITTFIGTSTVYGTVETFTSTIEPATITRYIPPAPTSIYFRNASRFNVFVERNYAGSSDVQGRLAVGKNATLAAGFSVGDQLEVSHCCEYTLYIGEHLLSWPSGRNYFGNAAIGRSYSIGRYVMENECQIDIIRSPLNFTGIAAELRELSYAMSSWTPTVSSMRVVYDALKFSCSGLFRVEVVRVDDPDFFLGAVTDIEIPDNCRTTSGLRAMNQEALRNYTVIFNFPEATTLDIRDVGVRGMILAPYANISNATGVVWGNVYARELTGPIQVNLQRRLPQGNYPPYSLKDLIPESNVTANVTTIYVTAQPTYTGTSLNTAARFVVNAWYPLMLAVLVTACARLWI